MHSPLLTHAKRPREASVEIETPRASASTSLVATSNDRATAKPVLLHTTSDNTVHSIRIKTENQEDERDGEETREQKRRRIFIDREAVQEALALLDAGTAAQPRGSVSSASTGAGAGGANGGKDKDEMPCPCPWRPGEKRSP